VGLDPPKGAVWSDFAAGGNRGAIFKNEFVANTSTSQRLSKPKASALANLVFDEGSADN
jgi:hypothetical protein